ncbi:MAG: hypothetical protein ACI97P_000027 [Arcticibacterium sp.]|jgi:hypothetical protein
MKDIIDKKEYTLDLGAENILGYLKTTLVIIKAFLTTISPIKWNIFQFV